MCEGVGESTPGRVLDRASDRSRSECDTFKGCVRVCTCMDQEKEKVLNYNKQVP